jgi:TetR/AcrR family transcriptional repressor of nem operon
MVARYAERLAGDEPPREAIAAVLHEIARFAASPEGVDGCFMTTSAAYLAARDDGVRRILLDAYTRIEDAFARALRRERRAGTLAPERDPRAIARFLVTFIQGLRVLGTTRPHPRRLHDDVQVALRCLT